MKLALIIATFILGNMAWAAQNGLPDTVQMYKFGSDKIDGKVGQGKCRVYGKVLFNGKPLNETKVSTVMHEFFGVTGENGAYEFFMDADFTSLYGFHIGYDEAVTHDYNFKSGHSVQVDFFLRQNTDIRIQLKPVIYAYSQTAIKAEIKMELAGQLTFSYPNYTDAWNIEVDELGLKESGKKYPYLFWEGKQEGLGFNSSSNHFEGDQINTDSTISYLESCCNAFGFNSTERTDFISFWGPRITAHNFAQISFLVDEDYDQIGALQILPRPDNIRRVYILFKGYPSFNTDLITKGIGSFSGLKRDGFTIVEWGGSELSESGLDL